MSFSPGTLSRLTLKPVGVQKLGRSDGWSECRPRCDGRGFEVSGSHTFAFRDGKILSLKVVVAPRPQEAQNLALDGLSVEDVGRLALTAWAVV